MRTKGKPSPMIVLFMVALAISLSSTTTLIRPVDGVKFPQLRRSSSSNNNNADLIDTSINAEPEESNQNEAENIDHTDDRKLTNIFTHHGGNGKGGSKGGYNPIYPLPPIVVWPPPGNGKGAPVSRPRPPLGGGKGAYPRPRPRPISCMARCRRMRGRKRKRCMKQCNRKNRRPKMKMKKRRRKKKKRGRNPCGNGPCGRDPPCGQDPCYQNPCFAEPCCLPCGGQPPPICRDIGICFKPCPVQYGFVDDCQQQLHFCHCGETFCGKVCNPLKHPLFTDLFCHKHYPPNKLEFCLQYVNIGCGCGGKFPDVSNSPSTNPSSSPSSQPSSSPSSQPSSSPTSTPSSSPSEAPSASPSSTPSSSPSQDPSTSPSDEPSAEPSVRPSLRPSGHPSEAPSGAPTVVPSDSPSGSPSKNPSSIPSVMPSQSPSETPSQAPSSSPSNTPSDSPSLQPSEGPSELPSSFPSSMPSKSSQPSDMPSISCGLFNASCSTPTDCCTCEDQGWVAFNGSGVPVVGNAYVCNEALGNVCRRAEFCRVPMRRGQVIEDNPSPHRARQIIQHQGADPEATFAHQHSLITKESCNALIGHLEAFLASDVASGREIPKGKSSEMDEHASWTPFDGGINNQYNMKLYTKDLINLIGRDETRKILDFFYESLGDLNIDCMYLARHGNADGELYHVPWHMDDYSTMEITLNDDYEGGDVLHLTPSGAQRTESRPGTVTAHGPDIVHGITPNTKAPKYMLILKHHYNRPDKEGVVRISKEMVDELTAT